MPLTMRQSSAKVVLVQASRNQIDIETSSLTTPFYFASCLWTIIIISKPLSFFKLGPKTT